MSEDNDFGETKCCLNCIHKARSKSSPDLIYCQNTKSPARGNWMWIGDVCNAFIGKVEFALVKNATFPLVSSVFAWLIGKEKADE